MRFWGRAHFPGSTVLFCISLVLNSVDILPKNSQVYCNYWINGEIKVAEFHIYLRDTYRTKISLHCHWSCIVIFLGSHHSCSWIKLWLFPNSSNLLPVTVHKCIHVKNVWNSGSWFTVYRRRLLSCNKVTFIRSSHRWSVHWFFFVEKPLYYA